MKKAITGLLMAICLMGAKTDEKNTVFNSKEIVWYGLDFTSARFLGEFSQAGGFGEVSGSDLVDRWMPAWNNLLFSEQKKYDFKRVLRKKAVYYDLNNINELNSKINPDECFTYNTKPIDSSEIAAKVAAYKGDKPEGIGFSFVVESFNKAQINAVIHIVFFDIASKKVIFSEKMDGKPAGIGFRNFWAGAIYNVMKQIEEFKYKAWEKKYKD